MHGDDVFFGVGLDDDAYEIRQIVTGGGGTRTVFESKGRSTGPFTSTLAADGEHLYWAKEDASQSCAYRIVRNSEGEGRWVCGEERGVQSVLLSTDRMYVGTSDTLEEFDRKTLAPTNQWETVRGVGYAVTGAGVYAAIRLEHLWFVDGLGAGAVIDVENESVLVRDIMPLGLASNEQALFVLDVSPGEGRRVLAIPL